MSPSVAIAVGGIALSLIVMLISIAVVTGFKHEIKRKVEGFNSQIQIYPQSASLDRLSPISLTSETAAVIAQTVPEASVSPTVDMPGILKTDSAFQGIVFRGISAGKSYDFIASQIERGKMVSGEDPNAIAISSHTAKALGIDTCERIFAHFFSNGDLRTRRFTVAAIYDTHFSDYDKQFAFVDIGTMQRLAGFDSIQCTGIEINGVAEKEIPTLSTELAQNLLSESIASGSGQVLGVDNVLRSGAPYFSWLDLLDTNVVVILILMALVAGFTLISSLFILILERVRLIGILKAIGATNSQIRGIFIYMSERLVVWGLIIGNIIGLGFVWLQHTTRFIPLDPESYYLSYVPVEIGWEAILLLNLSVIAISCGILILPSHMVSTLSPAESIRYE